MPAPPVFELPKGSKQVQWEWLRQKVFDCETCKSELNPDGKIVFGEGDLDADIFLCGEAPGADEETAGVPFVGPAGDLLMKILAAMGLSVIRCISVTFLIGVQGTRRHMETDLQLLKK